MRYAIIVCLFLFIITIAEAAVLAPPAGYTGTWPPTWTGVSEGADTTVPDPNPIEGDNSHEFDYGKDQWGYWANLEINGVIMEMRYIEVESPDYGNGVIGGAFLMGAPPDEQGAREHEKPQLEVPLTDVNGSNAMWVSADECSQALWREVTGSDLSDQATLVAGEESQRGVDSQTYTSVTNFCSSLGGLISKTVDLPTEKEWEYLCRSGTATAFYTGRILQGFTGFSSSDFTTTSSDFMYDFSRADMEAGKLNVPNGDEGSGGKTPPWRLKVTSIDGDGIARFDQWKGRDMQIHGTITINGSSTLGMEIVAQFDSRFQWRYAPDHYGYHTPVLMLYYYDGTNYLPRPYGDPSAANMYYRYLDDRDEYVAVSAVEANLLQNHDHSNGHKFVNNNPASGSPFDYQDPDLAGDWYDDGIDKHQLEYREMIYVVNRYRPTVATPDLRNVNMAEWEEHFNGTHFLVSEPGLGTDSTVNRMYPIRSFYTRYRFYSAGTETLQSLPIQPSDDQIEEVARNKVPENEKGENGPNPEDDMTVEDYVFNYVDAIAEYYDDNNFAKDFWEPQTQEEKDNINKGDIIEFQQFTGFGLSLFDDEITVVGAGGVTSSIAANGRSPWGLLNMHGNLEEWTKTTWDGKSDHVNHSSGAYEVTRGGSWRTGADRCRSAARTARDPDEVYNDVGFRFIIRD